MPALPVWKPETSGDVIPGHAIGQWYTQHARTEHARHTDYERVIQSLHIILMTEDPGVVGKGVLAGFGIGKTQEEHFANRKK